MKMYARVIDNETKQCEVGDGTNIDFYASIGMEEMEVELGCDEKLYVKGYAPVKPEPTIEEQNEAIRATREQLYIQTSDKLKADYDEAVARGAENAEELKTAWLESKDKIRAENPYIVEENEPVVKESNSSDSVLSEASENKGQSESESEEVI